MNEALDRDWLFSSRSQPFRVCCVDFLFSATIRSLQGYFLRCRFITATLSSPRGTSASGSSVSDLKAESLAGASSPFTYILELGLPSGGVELAG